MPRAYFDFLEDTDRFHSASMRTAAPLKELGRAAAKFPAAMADRSRWRLAKAVFTAILAEGVDESDDAAVAAHPGRPAGRGFRRGRCPRWPGSARS